MKNLLKQRKLIQAAALILILCGVCLHFIGNGYTLAGTALVMLGAAVILILWGYDNRDKTS